MSLRVLIADPDLSLLESYSSFLTGHGFEVDTAPDGLACLARLRGRPPDVLVLEPDLPWGQGEGILTLMEEEMDLPKVPVVLLSARPGSGRKGGWRRLPGVARARKPVSPEQLEDCICRLICSVAWARG